MIKANGNTESNLKSQEFYIYFRKTYDLKPNKCYPQLK